MSNLADPPSVDPDVAAVPRARSGGRRRRLVALALPVALLAAWWFTLGPVPLGGHTTFAVVDGVSMEPTLQGGDLVVARAQSSYEFGETIVFPVAGQKVVIHRIVGGSAEEGWITQGDNNDRVDPWVVPNEFVLGRYWFEVPDLGAALLWTRDHPLVFGGAVAALVLALSLFGRRRRRLHPALAAARDTGSRTSRMAGRPSAEVLVLVMAGVTFVVTTVALVVLTAVGIVLSPAGALAAVVLVIALVAFTLLLKRLGDGWRVPEPMASRYALSTDCWEVTQLPEVDVVVDHDSALGLRSVAERRRLPVLHLTDATGVETYLTMTRDGVGHRWRVPSPTAVAPAHG